MTSSRLSLLLVVLSGLLLAGCPTDGNRSTFDYLRSPITFRVDPVADDHPFCRDQKTRPPGMDQVTCESTRKYRMRWERPEDTVGFKEYRVYIDTTPANAPEPWNEVRKEPSYASYVMTGRASVADSIIFYLTPTLSTTSPQTVDRGNPRIFALDTTGRTDESGRLVFAIATAYTESGLDGQPRYSWIITNDRFPPYPLLPAIASQARTLQIAWSRPRDPTSFFDPKADSGIIAGYVLKVFRDNLRPDTAFNLSVTYRVGGVDRTAQTTVVAYERDRKPGRRFWLPDSQRIVDRAGTNPLDSLYVTVNGLTPRDTIIVSLWAVDASGNFIVSDTGTTSKKFMTDTTQPSRPRLSLVEGSVERNRFAYTFTASSDSIESGGTLIQSPTPNANILEYRITRRRVGGPAGERGLDSVLQIDAATRDLASFTDTARYLPPGATYLVTVQAMDSTGHLSKIDSLTVTTASSQFTGVDSGATCPPGFIPMPAGSFFLGETPANSPTTDDERVGAGTRTLRSYCIEPREHMANASTFRTRVTWQQAHDICRDMGASAGDSTYLCTEAEWERACESTELPALLYGVQSERQDPGGVRYTCNIGTGDSAMALSAALRDPACISRDGAFDMAGNLSEWVLDPYTGNAGYPGQEGDVLEPGRPHTPVTSGSRRGMRGGNYLNTGTNPAALLRLARCSNRDTPAQLRPQAWPGCQDANREQIAVIYGDVTKPPRCFALPDSLRTLPIRSLAPGRDTNQILILVEGRSAPVNFYMPLDTAYRNQKPASATLTERTLAVVTFENSETGQVVRDTLDATQLLGRTDAQQTIVLTRDAAPPWSARRVNGAYDITYLYARVRSVPTAPRAYYSNQVIGFRCCSKPRRP